MLTDDELAEIEIIAQRHQADRRPEEHWRLLEAIPSIISELRERLNEAVRLEAELCATCGGYGWVTVGHGPSERDLPCGDCAECDEDEHGRIIAMHPREVLGMGGGAL